MPWLDVVIGVMISLVLSKTFNQPFFLPVIIGIFFVFLPDVDLAIWLVRHRGKLDRWSHEHRKLLHYPIIYLSLGYIITQTVLNDFYALLFLTCSFFHFFHDSFGIGWGIKWLFPFSRKNFKFLEKHSDEKRRLVASWNEQELKAMVEKWGRDDLPEFKWPERFKNFLKNL